MSTTFLKRALSPVANYAALPATGDARKLYLDEATEKLWRWDSVAVDYVEVASPAADIADHASADDPHGDRADAASKYQPLVAGKGLSTNDYTTDEKSKLSGIAAGATANSPDATLLARANHTGTQLAATISDFAATARGTALTGYAIAANTPIAATDTVLGATQKLEGDVAFHTEHNVDATPGDNYHYSDGATASRCNYCIPAMALAGKPFSILGKLPAMATPTGNPYLLVIGTTANSPSTRCIYIVYAGATIGIVERIDGNNFRHSYSSSFVTTWQTRARNFVLSFTPDTNPPVLLLQNDAGGYTSVALTASNSGTPPATWMHSDLVTTYITAGLNWPAGPMPTVRPIIGTFTPTDFIEYLTRGRVPMWASMPGNAATTYASNFSAGADSCTGTRATVAGNIDGVSDGSSSKDDCLQVAMDSTAAGTHFVTIMGSAISAARTTKINSKIRVTGEYLIPNANTVTTQVLLGASTATITNQTVSYALTTRGTWATFDVQLITNGSLLGYCYNGTTTTLDGNGTDVFYLRNITVTQCGTISAIKPQRCLYSGDLSANDIGWTSTAGITPVVMNDGREYAIAARTNTNGAQKLTGAAIWTALTGTLSTVVQDPLYFGSQVIDKIEVWSDAGGETVTVGSASGGSQYVTSATLSAGLNRLTLVTGIPASTDIWIGSNSANTLYWRIRCYKSAARGT